MRLFNAYILNLKLKTMNWTTSLYYAENGKEYQQEFDAPHLPKEGDGIIANLGKDVSTIMFTVGNIYYSNMTKSITIHLKR